MAISRRSMLLALLASCAAGRASGSELMPLVAREELTQNGRYLPYYLEATREAEAGKPGADQIASWLAAIVGDEKAALRFAGAWEMPTKRALSHQDLQFEDALDAIEKAAGNAQIVILNEAHHISRHRAFAGQVAERLSALGYNMFGAEAFAQPAVEGLRAGSPISVKSGLYVLDPVFAQTVRRVLSSGMGLFNYEQRPDQRVSDPDWKIEVAAREEAQAHNVADHMARHPDAKLLIYCGYDHVTEKGDRNGDWFATRLKALTGLDPVTIDQSQSWARFDPAEDPPHVKLVLDAYDGVSPICVKDGSGRAFTSDAYEGRVDFSVFHPRVADIEGRPGWLAADPLRSPATVSFDPSENVGLLQAFSVNEGWGSVPVDQMIVTGGQKSAVLFLPVGEYVVRIEEPERVKTLGRLDITT